MTTPHDDAELARPRPHREIALTATLMVVTAVAAVVLVWQVQDFIAGQSGRTAVIAVSLVFTAIVLALVHGNLIYLASRLGYYLRLRGHRPPTVDHLVSTVWDDAEPVTVLVPSYQEVDRTIRQTLLSAALLHYPRKRVVLLLDDPPNPKDDESAQLLSTARAIPGELTAFLETPRQLVAAAERRNRARVDVSSADRASSLLLLFEELITWLRSAAAENPPDDHTDRHFVNVVFGQHIALLDESRRHLVARASAGGLGAEEIDFHFRRLREAFTVEITAFERKRYANLSHEVNKAANLNAYIALIGTRVHEESRAGELHLVHDDEPEPTSIVIPDAGFVLTLDADSMLSPDYALRLAAEFAGPENERVAVVQTPYTAIPGAPGRVERIAGATTDVQYLIHQGFTFWNATFWVGANALLRKTALDDIRVDTEERGYPIAKYIQDRTVIEDTESTIDLEAKGWRLVNYPARLAYSATPPDFGALFVQRARWANGGLLIVPKAVRNALRQPIRRLPSLLVRLHYLSSIATASVGLLILLALPIDRGLFSWAAPVLAATYFAAYGRDLVHSGYRIGDLPRVIAFNLMLLPVNLAGVYKSLRQAVTGTRTPFARTPKVTGRTAAPAWSILALYGLLTWSTLTAVTNGLDRQWLNASYSLLLALGFGYAITAMVGVRAGWQDATYPVRRARESLQRRSQRATIAPRHRMAAPRTETRSASLESSEVASRAA